ncbi:MAG: hypothetical protein DLM59_07635 [Pseudonocardiales bacterium]|nr:MAG: hypothetical protein DLM59_07635 [Pseudonocardiales bacterium]
MRKPDDLDVLRELVGSRPGAEAAYQDALQRDGLLASMASSRQESGLNQHAVADAMGTSQSAISDLETGRAEPRLSTLQRYARAVSRRLDVRLVDDAGPDVRREAEERGLGLILSSMLPFDRLTVDDLANKLQLPERLITHAISVLTRHHWITALTDGPAAFRLNDQRALVIGVSIRHDHVVGVLTNLRTSQVIDFRRIAHATTAPEGAVAVVAEIVSQLRSAAVPGQEILGVGVEMAGVVDRETGVVRFAADFRDRLHNPWVDFDLEDAIETTTGFTTVVENDVNALATREHLISGDPGGVVVLLMGESGRGIGAALIANGTVVHGHDSVAGEIGHLIVDPSGPACRSGRHRGCLESVASTAAILDSISHPEQRLAASRRGSGFDLKHAAALAQSGDTSTLTALVRAGNAIGDVLSPMIALTDPARIVIYGPRELVDIPTHDSARSFMGAISERLNRSGSDKHDVVGRDLNDFILPRAAAVVAVSHFTARPKNWLPIGPVVGDDLLAPMRSVADPVSAY